MGVKLLEPACGVTKRLRGHRPVPDLGLPVFCASHFYDGHEVEALLSLDLVDCLRLVRQRRKKVERELRAVTGVTRDSLKGPKGPHIRFSSLISISEGHVYPK